MADLRELTQRYVSAFNAKDIDGVAALLSEEFFLTDPSVTKLSPRKKVIEYIHGLFKTSSLLRFDATRILVDGDSSAIHFTLVLDNKTYDGVDIVTWRHGKMSSMYAYLTIQPSSQE